MDIFKYLTERFPNGGWFVEAGAHDGVGDSQTLALEKAGWRGLCVEPSRAFAGLKEHRECCVDDRPLWYKSGHRTYWREVAGGAVELSGLYGGFCDHWDRESRPHADDLRITVGLTDLLVDYGAPSVIEFLCLDTEGSELSILAGHDFDRFLFKFVAVEHNGVERKRTALLKLLERVGMKFVEDDGVNLFMGQP